MTDNAIAKHSRFLLKSCSSPWTGPCRVSTLEPRPSWGRAAWRWSCPRRGRTADTPSGTPAARPPARTCTETSALKLGTVKCHYCTLCFAIKWSQAPHTCSYLIFSTTSQSSSSSSQSLSSSWSSITGLEVILFLLHCLQPLKLAKYAPASMHNVPDMHSVSSWSSWQC